MPNLHIVGSKLSLIRCGFRRVIRSLRLNNDLGARTEFPQTPGIIWFLLSVYVEEKVAFTPGEEVNFQEHRPMHLVTDQPQWRFGHRFNLDLG